MSHDSRWPDLLSPYLDGELDPGAARELEAHLAGCDTCRQMLDDLRAILAVAPAYRGSPPSRDLWPGIAEGIERTRVVTLPTRQAPRLFTLRQLIAASVLLAAAVGGLAWWAGRGTDTPPATSLAGPVGGTEITLAARTSRADSAYGGAIADLEAVLSEGRGRLDTATVRVIEQSLQVIDRAIAEARAAIAADPANDYLSGQVAANMRRKLDLLRRTAAAIQAAES